MLKFAIVLISIVAVTSGIPHFGGGGGDGRGHHGDFGHHGGDFGNHGFPNSNFENDQKIVRENAKEERNKKVVATFYQELFGNHDISAIDRYISPTTYIQHNPNVADGAAAFKTALSPSAGLPKETVDVKHIGADGDFVYYHLRDASSEPGEVYAIMDIFRLENGLIVEHWDVQQKVPKQAANSHPMF